MAAKRPNKRRRGWNPKRAKKPPNSFTYTFGSDFLQASGPVLLASWRLPQALSDQLLKEGKLVPDPVVGLLLVDTGASTTCIDNDVASQLSLTPIRISRTHGVHGEHEVNVYNTLLHIGIEQRGARQDFYREGETMGAEGISRCHKPINVSGTPYPVIGLLGRDVLRKVRFHYDGPKGVLKMTFLK